MLLEQVLEVIEYTDTDHLAGALELYNDNGFVEAQALPFLNVVFDIAPSQLVSKLVAIGFKGQPTLAKDANADTYVVFDLERFNNLSDIQQPSTLLEQAS